MLIPISRRFDPSDDTDYPGNGNGNGGGNNKCEFDDGSDDDYGNGTPMEHSERILKMAIARK